MELRIPALCTAQRLKKKKKDIGMECQEPLANRVPAWGMWDCGLPYASGPLVPTRKARQVRARDASGGQDLAEKYLAPQRLKGKGRKEVAYSQP